MADPIEPVYRALGARIEQLRRILDLTQEELASRVGLTRASVANIETNRQRVLLHDVEKFATALGTSPKNLLRGVWF